ncbi:MAG: serine hydrolase [Erythrobacter sp.]|uniref:serine hydrolase n=1 Tax=Erythrobacter sp. TaxID=1042 RepID=UPI0025D69F0D|nr:serine hydrolase [Erythrobacter sp.]MCL9998162.1 serine hydrolase [Erythrobacter sp.]
MRKIVTMTGHASATVALLAAALPAAAETAAPATTAATPSAQDLRALADAVLAESYAADGPGAAVVVMRGGKIVYTGGRGMADIAAGRAITPDTVFRLGSITKQFTAAVIVQLAQEGKLSLDDPLAKFLPDYPQPGAAATVRQLLQHTSGIQSYTDMPGLMNPVSTARALGTAEMIALFRDAPSPSKPGEVWNYNNSGYILLGAIIETVTGMPWHQAVEERIARPLGLASIRYGVGGEDTPAMAKGYTGEATAAATQSQYIHMGFPHAAGALIGTVGDLAKWGQALHHGKVVDTAHYQLMITPTVLPDGSTQPYGFGLGLDALREHPAIGHGGGIFGFSTDSIYVPDSDLFVAVFTNSDAPQTSPAVVMRRIAAAAVGDPYPAFTRTPADLAALEPFFGVYPIPGGGERRFFAREGKLFTQRSGGATLEVYAGGDNRFFYGPATLSWFALTRDADGTPVMDFAANGELPAQTSARSGPIPPEAAAVAVPRAELERYAGRYALGPLTLTIAFTAEGTGLTGQLTGQPPIPLEAIGPAEFRTVGVDARLTFEAAEGPATALTLHQGGQQMRAVRSGD